MRFKLHSLFAIATFLLAMNIAAHADTVYQFSWSYVYGIPQTLSWQVPTTPTSITPDEVQFDNPTLSGLAFLGSATAGNYFAGLDYTDSDGYRYVYFGSNLDPTPILSTDPDAVLNLGTYLFSGGGFEYFPDGNHIYLGDIYGPLTISEVEVTSPVPEPSSLILLATALVGVGAQMYRCTSRRFQSPQVSTTLEHPIHHSNSYRRLARS